MTLKRHQNDVKPRYLEAIESTWKGMKQAGKGETMPPLPEGASLVQLRGHEEIMRQYATPAQLSQYQAVVQDVYEVCPPE